MIVWVVVYSNYYPAEVDSAWTTSELAQARADKMNEDAKSRVWNVECWHVNNGTEHQQ